MEIKIIKTYFDLEDNAFVSVGAIKEVSTERANKLIGLEFAEEIKPAKKSDKKVEKEK